MALRKIPLLVALLSAAALISGCGSEPPQPGELRVTSEPEGAAILMDGQSTGQVTPHTFADLEGGTYVVAVLLEGWAVFPGQRTVQVPFGGRAGATFALSQQVGALRVESDPAGAAISLDGADTGEVTPHTFTTLLPGEHTVAVQLANHASQPESRTVTIIDGEEATASFDLVQLTVPRTLLLEGFSNVLCTGCPDFNADVDFVRHQPGYGPDRLLFVKWPPPVPTPLDPFYQQTVALTNARVTYYDTDGAMSLPSSYGQGVLLGTQGTPLQPAGMMDWADAQPAAADLSLAVTTAEDLADVADLAHDATVTLNAGGGLDLAGHELHVVLVYEEVETATTYQGVSTFHGVMRDHVTVTDLGTLPVGEDVSFTVTVNDPDPASNPLTELTPHGKQIIAWVQHASSRDVLQAGATASTISVASSASPPAGAAPTAHSGGTR